MAKCQPLLLNGCTLLLAQVVLALPFQQDLSELQRSSGSTAHSAPRAAGTGWPEGQGGFCIAHACRWSGAAGKHSPSGDIGHPWAREVTGRIYASFLYSQFLHIPNLSRGWERRLLHSASITDIQSKVHSSPSETLIESG